MGMWRLSGRHTTGSKEEVGSEGQDLGGEKQMANEPGSDEVLKALERAFEENPRLPESPTEEVARQLVRGGYLQEEPPLPLLEAVLDATREAEEPQPFGAGASGEGAMRGPRLEDFREPWEGDPMAEPVDVEAGRHELEGAGWERLEREGKLV